MAFWLMVEDTSNQPASVSSMSAGSLTTASFTPQVGTLLVATTIADSGPSIVGSAALSDSAGGSWTLLVRQNASSASIGGSCEVWCQYLASDPGGLTVTSTLTPGAGGILTVACILHAHPVQDGTTGGAGSSSQSPTVSIVATRIASRTYGAIIRWNAATAVTMNANSTLTGTLANTTNTTDYTTFKGNLDVQATAGRLYGATDAASAFQVVGAEIKPLWATLGQGVPGGSFAAYRAASW